VLLHFKVRVAAAGFAGLAVANCLLWRSIRAVRRYTERRAKAR
jgi:hypothetical protein